jgi:hypothetical protein
MPWAHDGHEAMTARDTHRLEPPSRRKLMLRLRDQLGYVALVVMASLLMGMAGYHWIAGLPWVDAFENAAMLLGGMGPVGEVRSSAAKVFAGVFALYSGLVFLLVTALVLQPVFHHVLHRFHWEQGRSD